jgi:5-methylcytosine-specific restriction enzyme subunit McrC
MLGITIHEFDTLTAENSGRQAAAGMHTIPTEVYHWLDAECLRQSDSRQTTWLRFTQRAGCRAIQVTSYVGVMRAPDGYQIEVLPKIGKAMENGPSEARRLLINMLSCLREFRHIQTEKANLLAAHMPLLEIFITEFLQAVQRVVKRGLRSTYNNHEDNLFVLRGKLLHSQHLRQNLFRADRFYTSHDEFTADRPINRLLHSALHSVIPQTSSQANQQLARELIFHFADIPQSKNHQLDFQQVNADRGMGYYNDALAWAKLILGDQSPLTGSGTNSAPSLLFPMEAVFEAYVTKHLPQQMASSLSLKAQVQSHYLVNHTNKNWFRMKPDLLIREGKKNLLVLDTKWKMLDQQKDNGTDKYNLSQNDFYQLYAYGQSYLDGEGDIVLIYPKTDSFDKPLPQFEFPSAPKLRLWAIPFCLKTKRLLIPEDKPFSLHLFKAQHDIRTTSLAN